jgi:hypothetical protein
MRFCWRFAYYIYSALIENDDDDDDDDDIVLLRSSILYYNETGFLKRIISKYIRDDSALYN